MYSCIKYSNGYVQGLEERKSKDACKEDLRFEISTRANGRHYEAVIRDNSETIFYYNSQTGILIDK